MAHAGIAFSRDDAASGDATVPGNAAHSFAGRDSQIGSTNAHGIRSVAAAWKSRRARLRTDLDLSGGAFRRQARRPAARFFADRPNPRFPSQKERRASESA